MPTYPVVLRIPLTLDLVAPGGSTEVGDRYLGFVGEVTGSLIVGELVDELVESDITSPIIEGEITEEPVYGDSTNPTLEAEA